MRTPSMIGAATLSFLLAGSGPLDPPDGPVASTHKTLTQVEPRTPIDQSHVPLIISGPGAFYLTESLLPVGFGDPVITIEGEDVDLDLNGFTIVGSTEVGQASAGVELTETARDTVIRNGTIRGVIGDAIGGGGGVGDTGTILVDDVRMLDNTGGGINLPLNAVHVADCTIAGNGLNAVFGASVKVTRCMIIDNGGNGVFSVRGLVQSNVFGNNQGNDVDVGLGTIVDNYPE